MGDVFADWIGPSTSQGATSLGSAILTEALLAPFQVIVMEDVREGNGHTGIGSGVGRSYSISERDAVVQWVAKGGGLLTLTGYGSGASENINVNTILAPLGLSYASTEIFHSGVSVSHWSPHPLGKALGSVWFAGGFAVSGSDIVAYEPLSGAYDVGRASVSGKGRVFAWGDESVTYGDVYLSAGGARFWLNVFGWLTPASQCRVVLPQ